MIRWIATLLILLAGSGLPAADSHAHAQLVATVREATGELRITNTSPEDFFLFAYSVTSSAANLRVNEWLPITDRLDADGDGSLDPDDSWIILAPSPPLPATASELTEAVFTGSGGLMAPGDRLYLGNVWNPALELNLQLMVADQSQELMDVSVLHLPQGDYNEDGLVDMADYGLWRDTYGATGIDLLADGNGDAVVDAIDYVVWRDHLGATATGLALSAPATLNRAVAVPEPTGGTLGVIGIAAALVGWVRLHRPGGPG